MGSQNYDIAKSAYDAYCIQAGGKSLISGATLPQFEDLDESIKDAWCAAALVVWRRAYAQTRNYTASDVEMPESVTFANGRKVSIVSNPNPNVHLGVFLKVE